MVMVMVVVVVVVVVMVPTRGVGGPQKKLPLTAPSIKRNYDNSHLVEKM